MIPLREIDINECINKKNIPKIRDVNIKDFRISFTKIKPTSEIKEDKDTQIQFISSEYQNSNILY